MHYWMTAKGLAQLQQLLQEKQSVYAEIRDQRQLAFELSGDGWHDNPEFNRMQQFEANINHQVKELTERIEQVRLMLLSALHQGDVDIELSKAGRR